jgi:hypothetical protein
MKTKILIVVAFLCIQWNGFAQDNLFNKLADRDDITQVTVTKALLNMMPGILSSMNVEWIDMKKIALGLEQLDIFAAESEGAKQLIRQTANELLKKDKSYEVLMKIKDGNDNVAFYGQKEGTLIKSLIMFSDDNFDCTLIRLLGKFTTEDIKAIVEKVK